MLHEDKFELIVHRAGSLDIELLPFFTSPSYTVPSGKCLYPVSSLKDLWVIVSPDLSWTPAPHVITIAARARSVASWVLGVFRTRDKITMLTLYKSLIRSHLEYCCPLWHSRKIGDIEQLEAVQRTFTSRIAGVQHLDYWERLKALGIMSLQRRRERYIILQLWKILHRLSPNDLGIQFQPPARLGIKAIVPPLKKTAAQRHKTMYDDSFAVLGPCLWNTIPGKLTEISSRQQFKNNLTSYLLTISDRPPVKGYCRADTNSLLNCRRDKTDDKLSRWSPLAMAWWISTKLHEVTK